MPKSRLTPAEFEYLEGSVNTRLEQLGPYHDVTRYVAELRAQLDDQKEALTLIRSMATDRDARPIEEVASSALNIASAFQDYQENFPDQSDTEDA